MQIYITSLLGFVIFIADIWAIFTIAQSKESVISKLLWIVLILFLPLIGLVIWWIFGPRK
ncbi:PLDc N-terminal domain-containing protein [Zhongshania borealis]|uniref:PLDc N-terminal domain-containing protein n=1 Tax=Zhongshania borealis TaxID=889488 RepID=A0ABP7WT44_9GAMM